jgi:hypothetical protein
MPVLDPDDDARRRPGRPAAYRPGASWDWGGRRLPHRPCLRPRFTPRVVVVTNGAPGSGPRPARRRCSTGGAAPAGTLWFQSLGLTPPSTYRPAQSRSAARGVTHARPGDLADPPATGRGHGPAHAATWAWRAAGTRPRPAHRPRRHLRPRRVVIADTIDPTASRQHPQPRRPQPRRRPPSRPDPPPPTTAPAPTGGTCSTSRSPTSPTGRRHRLDGRRPRRGDDRSLRGPATMGGCRTKPSPRDRPRQSRPVAGRAAFEAVLAERRRRRRRAWGGAVVAREAHRVTTGRAYALFRRTGDRPGGADRRVLASHVHCLRPTVVGLGRAVAGGRGAGALARVGAGGAGTGWMTRRRGHAHGDAAEQAQAGDADLS